MAKLNGKRFELEFVAEKEFFCQISARHMKKRVALRSDRNLLVSYGYRNEKGRYKMDKYHLSGEKISASIHPEDFKKHLIAREFKII